MAKIGITYGELENGMKVWVGGYLFEVCNVRSMVLKGLETVRFEGRCVDPECDISRTGYNGGTYGGVASYPCTIVVD